MSWAVIARREFRDAVQSRVVWGVVALVAVMVAVTSMVPLAIPAFDANVLSGLGAATEFAAMLVPIVALVAAYLSIAGERESGSIRILLGLEPRRGTVVLGKFLGRAAVVVVGLVAGFALAAIPTAIAYGGLPVVAFAGIVALTCALGVAFVGIAVGVSAAAATRGRAMTLGIAAYLALALLWDLVPQGAHLVVEGAAPAGTVPGWFVLVQGLSPSGAYGALVQAVVHATDDSFPGIAGAVADGSPAYLHWSVFAVVLAAWTALPLLAGYATFARSDLG
ncbi:ABC transporter permease subunit [Halorubellus sp. JP-L1]|uniref:ABC transporter permease subunit n=1 Tax=Halorubellus sp. JP-L1 TaxID=2715753 RepID=UPI00140A6435|nr:ABC transporter permease subunit [Halorubellus sp. JP-L1]NHN43092.1 ABC transporter permease subunit [Halorubellus sp. JP-L1]